VCANKARKRKKMRMIWAKKPSFNGLFGWRDTVVQEDEYAKSSRLFCCASDDTVQRL
jgi:hypothetical protein